MKGWENSSNYALSPTNSTIAIVLDYLIYYLLKLIFLKLLLFNSLIRSFSSGSFVNKLILFLSSKAFLKFNFYYFLIIFLDLAICFSISFYLIAFLFRFFLFFNFFCLFICFRMFML